ncbi:MAG: TOTE conflict system archaeo-eukaryotic primase domain-containing protein [Thermoleophilia bacterium]
MNDKDTASSELAALRAHCQQLEDENAHLRSLLKRTAAGQPDPPPKPGPVPVAAGQMPSNSEAGAVVTADSRASAKLALFRALFSGRDDVYARRWEGRGGRSGYTPACANEWNRALCAKPQVKCSACAQRVLLPLTDRVVRDHLTGRQTIGVYPLLSDETCRFLVLDFDKADWRRDVAVVMAACEYARVAAYVEISRSGCGAHLWVFFSQAIAAAQARRLGAALITRATAQRHELGLDSYDRLFPGQDTLPQGGFGNLIALPLQSAPRAQGRSVFVAAGFQAVSDQWRFLAAVRRLSLAEVEGALARALAGGDALGARIAVAENEAAPWTLPPSGRRLEERLDGPFPETVEVMYANLVYVAKQGLPQAMLDRIIRLAAFENPEFYRAQALRLPTFAKPRLISCAEEFSEHIAVPRGCLTATLELLKSHGIEPRLSDQRTAGEPLAVRFVGELTTPQMAAAEALAAHDCGVLCAATAFGKTVVGAWLIAARGVNTLVLVHRRQLMDQWRERLLTFLDLPETAVGVIGGGRVRATGKLDIAIIQSLNKKGEIADLVADYGQVIVDECHHLSAFSFERVLKQVRARYVVGLTATPVRRDGHQPIITMQCGPIRYRTDLKGETSRRALKRLVVARRTDFTLAETASEPGIQAIYSALAADADRNALIVADVSSAVAAGRSPLVLTERTEHRDLLAAMLAASVGNVFVMSGGMGAKKRGTLAAALAALAPEAARLIIATGRCVGEGFDDARLDTLFLALPVAWRGTLQQYAGRLHREHVGKDDVLIYDYVDERLPVLMRMYHKRLAGYRTMGYALSESAPPPPSRVF